MLLKCKILFLAFDCPDMLDVLQCGHSGHMLEDLVTSNTPKNRFSNLMGKELGAVCTKVVTKSLGKAPGHFNFTTYLWVQGVYNISRNESLCKTTLQFSRSVADWHEQILDQESDQPLVSHAFSWYHGVAVEEQIVCNVIARAKVLTIWDSEYSQI